MLSIRKIHYRGRKYWLLQANGASAIESRVDSIAGSRWSRSKNGWLIPGTEEGWTAFKKQFKNSEYQLERAYFSPKLSGHKARIEFEVMPTDPSRVIVRMRKFTKRHLEVIRRVDAARYHVDVRYWSVPNQVQLLEDLSMAFDELSAS